MVFDKIGSFFLWLTSSKLGRYDVQNTEIVVKDVASNVTADPGAYGFLDVKSGELICELDDEKAVFFIYRPLLYWARFSRKSGMVALIINFDDQKTIKFSPLMRFFWLRIASVIVFLFFFMSCLISMVLYPSGEKFIGIILMGIILSITVICTRISAIRRMQLSGDDLEIMIRFFHSKGIYLRWDD